MKIAIASNGKTIDSKISPLGGRAHFYLIFKDNKLIKIISNPFRIGGGGAGFSVAKVLINEKVDLVISGNFGPNMLNALKEKKIKLKIETEKTVKEALENAKT
jgi:predicted Fe-Mo cluster-binding NifX family protein